MDVFDLASPRSRDFVNSTKGKSCQCQAGDWLNMLFLLIFHILNRMRSLRKSFMLALVPLLIILMLSGCIGTDEVDAPLVEKRFEISPDRIALLIDNSTVASASYFNEYGVKVEATISWSTEPATIASVDASGKVTGVSPGQAQLFATFAEFIDSVRIAVVLNENAAASVDISAPKTSLNIGESLAITYVIKNINDDPITTSTILWQSSNESVVTIASDGTLSAVGNGTATVVGISDGVYSNEITFTVSGTLMGTFVPQGGYMASGTASLKVEGGNLILEFSSNFTTSYALGTYIYMANSISSGTAVQSGGIELGQISTNGMHSWNITQLFPGTTASQYQYVVILCKPANVLFGYAQLQ